MKNVFYLLVSLAFLSCGQNQNKEQVDTTSKSIDTSIHTITTDTSNLPLTKPTSIAEIKENHALTIGLLAKGQLDSVAYKYNCQGERSGTVTYFSQKGQLRMIKHQYNEYDHYSATDQYFIADDAVFFTFLNSVVWSFESGSATEGATKDEVTEQRIYILNNQPIQCLEKKFSIRSKANNNPKPENIPNKEVACSPIQPLLKQYKNLIAFKDGSDHSCLGN